MSGSSHPATARLFVAVDPPPAVCRELAAWARDALGAHGAGGDRDRARRARLLGAETMHVTLCFLGERAVEEIDAIAAAVASSPDDALQLHVGAPLWLPPRRPRALALAVHDRDGELSRLHAALADAIVAAIDWEPDRRRFRAHVTVARLGRDARERRGERGRRRRDASDTADGARADAASALPPSPRLTFGPRNVVLYRSLLSPDGASYEAISTRTLCDASASSTASSSLSSGPELLGGGLPEPDSGHDSVVPPSTSVGCDPSSHSGAEPSSHA